MLASSLLQTAVNAYRKAGLSEDSKRTRFEMEAKIVASRAEMAPVTFETIIPAEDMELFLSGIVDPDAAQTLANIAGSFLQRLDELEASIARQEQQAPLAARISQTIIADNRVSAIVGSVDDDPYGRLLRQATIEMSLNDVWLVAALERAIEVHHLTPEHLVGWVGRSGLFDDLTLILEGIGAWYEGDLVKAIHVLVPQVERGLRGIVSSLERPVTKPSRKVPGVSVAIGMGDILYEDEVRSALGPRVTLHLLTIYADPRGFNLRNELAHGLLKAEEIHRGLVAHVVHSMLLLGVWDLLARADKGVAAKP